jgi:hypothetical protein
MALIDDVRRVLRNGFPGSTVKIASFAGGRVGGNLIWKGFDGQAQIDRQSALRKVIDTLPPHEQLKVSFILTVTPEEQSALTK